MISAIEAGADPSGQQSSTDAIQRAIDNNPGEAIFFPHGVYTLASRLTLRSGTSLFAEKDAVIKAAESLKSKMIATDGPTKGITLRGLIFDQSEQGVPPTGQNWDVLELGTADDVVIHNCTFTGGLSPEKAGGDSHIMIGSSKHVRISDCFFENASDAGIYVSNDDCSGIVICHNHFTGCGKRQDGHSISIKRGARDTAVHGNVFDSAKYGVVHEEGNEEFLPGAQSIITGNTFRDISIACVLLRKSDYSIVSNNRFDGSGLNENGAAVDVQGSSFCSLTGNVFQNNRTFGIRFSKRDDRECRSNIVSGNVFVGPGTWVIELDGTTDTLIRYTPSDVVNRPVELNVRA